MCVCVCVRKICREKRERILSTTFPVVFFFFFSSGLLGRHTYKLYCKLLNQSKKNPFTIFCLFFLFFKKKFVVGGLHLKIEEKKRRKKQVQRHVCNYIDMT